MIVDFSSSSWFINFKAILGVKVFMTHIFLVVLPCLNECFCSKISTFAILCLPFLASYVYNYWCSFLFWTFLLEAAYRWPFKDETQRSLSLMKIFHSLNYFLITDMFDLFLLLCLYFLISSLFLTFSDIWRLSSGCNKMFCFTLSLLHSISMYLNFTFQF